MTDPTQPSTHNSVELNSTNKKPSGTKKTILIYHYITVSESFRYYSFISIYQWSPEAYQVLEYFEMFLTHDPI